MGHGLSAFSLCALGRTHAVLEGPEAAWGTVSSGVSEAFAPPRLRFDSSRRLLAEKKGRRTRGP